MSLPYRLSQISSLPLPFLLLPSSRSRHNLLDSLLSSYILGPLLGETKETKDENFGDAVILITPFGNLCRCTIILPTSLPPNNIHVKHSAYVTVLSPSVGYGVDVEEGYDFVQSHLSEILSSLPSVFVCIPESWEPEEVCDRYKGMEAFKGVVKDGTKDAWHVWQRLDNSSLPPSLWDGHAVFKRVSNMVSKTRMNGTERKGLSLLLMNDIVEEYETLSQVITVERREIERNCGKGVGGGCRVVADKTLPSEWFSDAEAYRDGVITTDPKVGTQGCYGIEVVSTARAQGAGRMGWLALSSSGYYPNRKGEEEDQDAKLAINKNSDAGVKGEEDDKGRRIKEYRRVANVFRRLGDDLRRTNQHCDGVDFAEAYERVVRDAVGDQYETTTTLIGAEGLKGLNVRGAHLVRIKVGSNDIVYGDTYDPLTGARLTSQVETFNMIANAPWAEWREDRLAAERIVEDRHSGFFKDLIQGDEGRGKWRVYFSDNDGDWAEFDGYIRTGKGGVVLRSEVVGSLIIRYDTNVRKYYRDKDYYEFEVIPDQDDGRDNVETLHPVVGLLGTGLVDTSSDGGVWVRVYDDGMWEEWKGVADDDGVEKVWVDRKPTTSSLPSRHIKEMEIIKGREKEADENGVEVSIIYGPSGGYIYSLVNEVSPRFPEILSFEFTSLSSYSDFDTHEIAAKIVSSGKSTLVVITSPFTSVPIIESLSNFNGIRLKTTTACISWCNHSYNPATRNSSPILLPVVGDLISNYTTSVICYVPEMGWEEKDLWKILGLKERGIVMRVTKGTLDEGIKEEVGVLDLYYEKGFVDGRREEVAWDGEYKGEARWRTLEVEGVWDVNHVSTVLERMLGVKWIGVSSLMEPPPLEAEKGKGGWWKKMAILARKKVERDWGKAAGRKMLEEKFSQFESEFRSGNNSRRVISISGSFKSPTASVLVSGYNSAHRSLNFSSAPHSSGFVTIMADGMDEEGWSMISEMLNSCRPTFAYEKKAAPKLSDINPDKLDSSHVPLPKNWQYTGTSYVSFTGDTSKLRPDIDDIVERELTRRRGEVDKWNMSVEKRRGDEAMACWETIQW